MAPSTVNGGRLTADITGRPFLTHRRHRETDAIDSSTLSMANSQILAQTDRPGQSCEIPTGATVRIHEAPAHTRRPPVGHHRQTRAPGRSTRCRGRILVAKAPVAHQ